MIRMFFAGTTVKPREWNHLKDAQPLYKNHKNIIFKKGVNTTSYYFPGPLWKASLDQGNYTIEKNFKRGVEILSKDINDFVKNNPDKELVVEIGGHSRGGVAAGRVAKKIENDFKSNKNVKVSLISLDPVPGPGHFSDDVKLELPENGKSVVIYSVTPSILYSPQVVKNSDVAIIVPRGHESVYGIKGGTSLCDTHEKFYYWYKGKSYTLSELPNLEKGAYMCFNAYELTKLNDENLKECVEKVYKSAVDPKRVRILMDTIIEAMDLNLDQMLNANTTYKNEFNKTVIEINKSWFLTAAFNHALELFKSKNKFSYMINKDDIYESILNAKKLISGVKVDPLKSCQILKNARDNKSISESSKHLLTTLINRIERRYDLNK